MRLTPWRLHIVVDGRAVTVAGEMLVPMEGQPDFVVFSGMLRTWDDGAAISEDDKARIVEAILAEAEVRGARIAID
jgi:hypothetical protein